MSFQQMVPWVLWKISIMAQSYELIVRRAILKERLDVLVFLELLVFLVLLDVLASNV